MGRVGTYGRGKWEKQRYIMSGLNNHYITQRAKNLSDIYIKQHGIEEEIIWPLGPCSLLLI